MPQTRSTTSAPPKESGTSSSSSSSSDSNFETASLPPEMQLFIQAFSNMLDSTLKAFNQRLDNFEKKLEASSSSSNQNFENFKIQHNKTTSIIDTFETTTSIIDKPIYNTVPETTKSDDHPEPFDIPIHIPFSLVEPHTQVTLHPMFKVENLKTSINEISETTPSPVDKLSTITIREHTKTNTVHQDIHTTYSSLTLATSDILKYDPNPQLNSTVLLSVPDNSVYIDHSSDMNTQTCPCLFNSNSFSDSQTPLHNWISLIYLFWHLPQLIFKHVTNSLILVSHKLNSSPNVNVTSESLLLFFSFLFVHLFPFHF